ncbi:hypothetical protein FUA23_20640 [Neolewinella aurantiaca]|uniref:Phospholipid scramblase n=1 Tax=Neolewinella aurantiaca TaxID=2602767 RepID=A0A5C7F5U0_9BACT|nr:hypothetical protein [Neolewinella aurantiaca]TXF85423.1 hypothetical protein FUA23_20640 [Neolewinella aurantiaca]
MKNLNYPLTLKFKVAVINPQFSVADEMERPVAFVKQKAFKLKEDISVYKSAEQSNLLYKIKADRWLDYNASYSFLDSSGKESGRLVRKGARSLWKAEYELYDENGKQDLLIQEDNPWVRVADNFLGEIPFLGLLTGYLFNPTYNITRPDGTQVATFRKKPDLVSRAFTLEKNAAFEEGEETRLVLGVMMMVFLERARG